MLVYQTFIVVISIMFRNQSENNFQSKKLLKNGAIVPRVCVEIIMDAITKLLKENFVEFGDLVEFCVEKIKNREISLLSSYFSEKLDINDDRITVNQIVNVILSAVDRDLVLHSPYPEDTPEHIFYPKKRS